MGFMKDTTKLYKQGRDMQKNMDVGQQMSDAKSKMAAANEMMAKQTQAANLALTGIDGEASITSAVQTGAMINFQPAMVIEMTVFPAGGVPYPAQISEPVPQQFLQKAAPGQQVKVKIDANDPSIVWVDWASSLTL